VGVSLGTFFFLRDHYVNNTLIPAGTTQEMFTPWIPTLDVEPLDTTSTLNFFLAGPGLGAVINRTRPPTTYWKDIGHNRWALTGLGVGFSTVLGNIGRVE
jgi:hypothetical protein